MGANTSGVINTVSIQISELIIDALQDLRVLGDGAVPTQNDQTDAMRKLNFILKKLPTNGSLLWSRDLLTIPLVANENIYSIGPAGGSPPPSIVAYRPLRAYEGCFVRYSLSNGQSYDTQLRMLSRLEYQQISNKQATGVINSWYYDPQMAGLPQIGATSAYDPTQSQGFFYFYVTPSDATRTAYVEVQRPLQEVTAITNTLDLPLEWYGPLSKKLSAEIADKYEIPEQRIARLKAEAKEEWKEILDWGATEQAPVYFIPDPILSIGNRQ
jgi:hypothetical protein